MNHQAIIKSCKEILGEAQEIEMISIEQVRTIVECIASLPDCEPEAHMIEDHLFETVLMAIANGSLNPEALAYEALKSKKITFARWYE